MLCLLLQIGDARFALEARQVVEVLPLVQVRPVLEAPPGLAGLMIYRGTPVPVIDLSRLCAGRPAPARLSTRILVVEMPSSSNSRESSPSSTLGLIAERATGTRRFQPDAFVASAASSLAGFNLAVATDERGFIYRLDLRLLFQRFARPPVAGREIAPTPCASTPSQSY